MTANFNRELTEASAQLQAMAHRVAALQTFRETPLPHLLAEEEAAQKYAALLTIRILLREARRLRREIRVLRQLG